MNALDTDNNAAFACAKQAELLGSGLAPLRAFAESRDQVQSVLRGLADLGDEAVVRRSDRMMRQLETFEPSVTMIGQIKSGKTSLVNALIGVPDLLPADVNPWTSVVTSLHLYPETPGFKNTARFRFFDAGEWDHLITGGGRMGELASRAGAQDELDKIKRQVAQMREKSRMRLGDAFETLLGQQHDHDGFDKALIERYVCLGETHDADDLTAHAMQGRFADITRSADLHMARAALPMRLCVRDTPGVNDTFLMREQITIRAIRDSRICVVVLSAHQALSSTDMALIRLISLVKSRDVIIFVNRVDELSDPGVQVPQIRESIAATLSRHSGPKDAEIIFGSALWASHALQMRLDALPPSSAASLVASAACAGPPDEITAWRLSGLPALQDAISQRVAHGSGATLVQRIGSSARNLASGLVAAQQIGAQSAQTRAASRIGVKEAQQQIRTLVETHTSALRREFDLLLSNFAARMARVEARFLDHATAALADHLGHHGVQQPWCYDPAGLRVMLRASHKVLARQSQSAFDKATATVATQILDIYTQAFALGGNRPDIVRPRAPQVPPPVCLARTIVLDLNGTWWKRWWLRRQGNTARAQSFHDLIQAETRALIDELREDLARSVRDEALAHFDAFLSEQIEIFERLRHMHNASPDELLGYIAKHAPQERRTLLARTMATLDEVAGA